MPDPFDLQRFVDAQAGVVDEALAELRRGRKTSHWMWFIFPQLAALGRSPMAKHYGLRSLDEARAYWAHPLLGPRLQACCDTLLALPQLDVHHVFGTPDDLKLRSCLTLFERAAPEAPVFGLLLDAGCGGQRDPLTLVAIGAAG